MQVERIGGSTKTYWPTDWMAGDSRSPARRDDTAIAPVERPSDVPASGLSTVTHVPVQIPTPREAADEVAEQSDIPPFGGLPSTRSVLSALTPADRVAIAGVTGYRLSPNGQITNPGGIPPWSFILGYAEHRRSQPVEDTKPLYASSVADGAERPDAAGRVDLVA